MAAGPGLARDEAGRAELGKVRSQEGASWGPCVSASQGAQQRTWSWVCTRLYRDHRVAGGCVHARPFLAPSPKARRPQQREWALPQTPTGDPPQQPRVWTAGRSPAGRALALASVS